MKYEQVAWQVLISLNLKKLIDAGVGRMTFNICRYN